MKLGVFTVVLGGQSVEEAFRYLSESGVQAVEIGTGGYPGTAHANPDELLADDGKMGTKAWQRNTTEINALSCHGNPMFILKRSGR